MFDEDIPVKKADAFTPRNLEPLSVNELGEYIEELEGEIARVKEDIDTKKDVFSAAENVFK